MGIAAQDVWMRRASNRGGRAAGVVVPASIVVAAVWALACGPAGAAPFSGIGHGASHAAKATSTALCTPEGDDAAGDEHAPPLIVDEQRGPDADAVHLSVVPCGWAESGAWGAACADTAFYVVTPGGMLLCQADLGLLGIEPSTPVKRLSNEHSELPSTRTASAHAVLAGAGRVPPPIVIADVPRARGRLVTPPPAPVRELPPVPS